MAGPLNFTINYICSPNAVSGILEYRRLQANGNWTNWIPDLAAGNPFAINTQGGTVLNQTLSNVPGNGTDFTYNTTYDFRIKQICDTGAIEYSNISDPIYALRCPTVQFLSSQTYDASGYSLVVRLYDNLGIGYPMNPNLCSIISYEYDIKTYIGGVLTSIGFFTIPASTIPVGGSYYDFNITTDDLLIPIESFTTYYLDISFTLDDGSTVIIAQPCEALQSVITPSCSTYRIYVNEYFVLEYRDCNGVLHKCGGDGTRFNGYSFYICSQTQPKGYACIGNLFKQTTSISGTLTVQPTQLFVPSVTPFDYLANGNPAILYGALVELISTNACDSNFNGNLFDVTSVQVGAPWYAPGLGPIACGTPTCSIP